MDPTCKQTRHFEWKIHNFKDFLQNRKNGHKISTDDFSINWNNESTKWSFNVQSNQDEWVVYLYLKSLSIKNTVKFEAIIRGPGNKIKSRSAYVEKGREFQYRTGFGLTLFSFDDLSNLYDDFLDNSTLHLCLKVQLLENFQSDEEKEACTDSCQYFAMCKELFNTKSFTDIMINCADDVIIRAHRFILTAFSSVMKVMLNDKVPSEGESVLDVRDMNSAVMTEILRFLYTQDIVVSNEVLPGILHGAVKYEIIKLKELCVIKMMESLSVTNALEYFLLADKYNIKELLDDCAVFIKLHHDELCMDDKWDKFEKKHWMMMLDCYRHNIENVHVFESTI